MEKKWLPLCNDLLKKIIWKFDILIHKLFYWCWHRKFENEHNLRQLFIRYLNAWEVIDKEPRMGIGFKSPELKMPKYDRTKQLEQKIIEYEQLFWLASREIIFFHQYNEEVKTWDRGWYAAVLCNDTFFWACADAEDLAPDQAHKVKAIYEKYGWSGVVAWCAVKRGMKPLEQLQDEKYFKAIKELKQETN